MAGLVVCVDCVFRQKLEHSVPGKAQGQFFSATDVARVSAAHPGAFGCYPNLRASVIPRVRCAYPGYAVAIFLHSGCAQSMEKAVDKPVQALCCNALGAMVNISPAFPDAPRCFPTKATRTAKRMPPRLHKRPRFQQCRPCAPQHPHKAVVQAHPGRTLTHCRAGCFPGALRLPGLQPRVIRTSGQNRFSTAAVCNGWRRLWTSLHSPCATRVSRMW